MKRTRLEFYSWPSAIYAIGDVHGCFERLIELEALIADDGKSIAGEKWLVTLGDYVDRGPSSRAVIEHVMGPGPAGFRRFALLGNHEQMMLDFLADPRSNDMWLEEGGLETLASYGHRESSLPNTHGSRIGNVPSLETLVPKLHLEFLLALPISLALPGWLFVHAGIRPGVPMWRQSDRDLMWIRTPFLTSPLPTGLRVVHGHTPGPEIVVTASRIGIDTGCFRTGRLSGVRITADGAVKTLSVDGSPS